ncbi:MAG: alginate lyase family protein [Ardenticatenaceae bacterium]
MPITRIFIIITCVLLVIGGASKILARDFGQAQASSSSKIDDFEDVSDWIGLDLESSTVREGAGAGRWEDHLNQKTIKKIFDVPEDASGAQHVQFWAHSAVANGAGIELIFDSNNEADPEGSNYDYYAHTITVDWTGWRYFLISLADFRVTNNPVGWHEINYVSFNAHGWGHSPQPDTLLIIDDMRFAAGVLDGIQREMGYVGADFVYTYTLDLVERTDATQMLSLTLETEAPFLTEVLTPQITLPISGTAQAIVQITVPAAYISLETELDLYQADLFIADESGVFEGTTLEAAVPLPARPRLRPHLLLEADDFTRIEEWVDSVDGHAWALNASDEIIEAADGWPTTFTETYYLTETWTLPPEGGQSSQSDQVIYGRMHDDLAQAALDLALAYQLKGEQSYAEKAAEILQAYADSYLNYLLHHTDGSSPERGARVHAQTLDEAIWLIKIAWAYDLIADTLEGTARSHIETDLLRAAVTTISRNPMGKSNWQSWHNAGLGAVGFALEDPVIISQAIRDPLNGFDYQMDASVTAEGSWYEGSWGYHFYALTAHRYLAEMATRAGHDLYSHKNLELMFELPVQFAMPDWTLPPFNDSKNISLISYDGLYESAYRRYENPIPGRRTRKRNALFWGAETLPDSAELSRQSKLFPDTGIAVLRANDWEKSIYLALDYGPHGGSHGHYDKLGFVLYARDTMMGIDPGTQSYAAPTHESWDEQTIAHNTVVVDGQSQAEATGTPHRFAALPGLAMVAVDAGEAYTTTDLLRTMLVSSDYVLDHFRVRATDGASHDIDWIYHNTGTLTTSLPLAPYGDLPTENGYQHLEEVAATMSSDDWEATFNLPLPYGADYGSVWSKPSAITPTSTITATFTVSQEQVHRGSASGKLTYDFSAETGYILYQTESPQAVDEVPETLRLVLYGDGSGHNLTVRVYDSTDERFILELGAIDWTGWRIITPTNIISWSHNSGNEDGIFDLPVSKVAVLLDHNDGSPAVGTLYVDDITLIYPTAGEMLLENFDVEPRGMHLRMLGEPDTTIVTGNGLGPDRQQPVPFAMARRHEQETTFTALLEPISATSVITSFTALPTDASASDEATTLALTGDGFEDKLLAIAMADDASSRRTFTFGDAACDGVLCLVRRDHDGDLLRLILADGTTLEDADITLIESNTRLAGLQVDYSAEGTHLALTSNAPLTNTLRIFAPTVTTVTLNGIESPFNRDGDYVLPTSWTISMHTGWNHIALSLEPVVPYTAESVCNEINEQGGSAVKIDRWHNGNWEGHTCGRSFNNFELVLSEGYFIKSGSQSTWTIEGNIIEATPLTLRVSWNSIAIPHTEAYTAESLCDEMISQGVTVLEIDRWHNSGWQGHICGLPFNDFNIERATGYFVKTSSAGTVTPSAPATLRQAQGTASRK